MEERPYITCRELIDFLYLYVSGELPPDRREEFERHLGACPACVDYLRSYESTIRQAKAALSNPEQPVDEGVPEELVAAILEVRRKGA